MATRKPGFPAAPTDQPPAEAALPSLKKKRQPRKRDEQPFSAPSYDSESDQTAGMLDEQSRQQRLYDTLCTKVCDDIRLAVMAREGSGIEQIWMDDEDQYNGVDDVSAPLSAVKTRDQIPKSDRDNRSRVFVPITKPKTDIGVARVSEMLLPTDDRPWDIGPTKMPDMDEAAGASPDTMTTLGDGTQAPAAAVAMMILDKAKAGAKAEADWIEDKFQEGKVYAEMRQVVADAGRIGTGVIKGPFPTTRRTIKWKTKKVGDQIDATCTIGDKVEPTSTCIRAQDCYPDPGCGDSIHNGEFFVERDYITPRALRSLATLPGYDPKAIVRCIQEGPKSFMRSRDPTYRHTQGDTSNDSKLYEVFYYYGFASPDQLSALMASGMPAEREQSDGGVDSSLDTAEPADRGANGLPADDADGLKMLQAEFDASPLSEVLTFDEWLNLAVVPVIVTMVNQVPIKAELNPLKTGRFPYNFFRWEKIKGQPWGRGIPRKMGVAQRILNAAVRALLENAGLSTGPQIVTMKGAITPWDNTTEVRGRKGWDFDPDTANGVIDDVRKAFQVFEIKSVQPEMQALIQFALDLADILTNLPMLMQGDQQAGTSPETLGGMKMLFNNAMSPLRNVAKWFDDDLNGPHLQGWHDWVMQDPTVPAEAKGGDNQIITKGSTTMIQREEGREFLAQVFPVKDDPTLRIDPVKLIIEMARGNGFDMKTVQYTEDEWKQKQAEDAKKQPPLEPVVQAAQIRAAALVKGKEMDTARMREEAQAEAAADLRMQQHEMALKGIDKLIEDGKLSVAEKTSLATARARLAEVVLQQRTVNTEMGLKMDPANRTHQGI